ncbi:MAG: FTR1 family protein [Deltaproteobacteria bacterium]|nr:FTR1 family protein [Deltaproteobacteria bacterium]
MLTIVATAFGAAATPDDLAATIRAAAERYPAGDAHLAVGDAFLQFETSPADADLKGRNPSRYADLEVRWLGLVAAMRDGRPAGEVREQAAALAATLDDLGGDVETSGGRSSLFLDACLIILREGFEAIVVLAALAASLEKVRQGDKRRLLYAGAGTAVAASVALAVAARLVAPVGGHAREALEGVTMLAAAAVLFTASYWLISKAEARRWQEFVRAKLKGALSSRRRGALFVLAFLVVFREGFETVLFYEALLGRARAATATSAVWSGVGVGVLGLAVVAALLFRYGIRVPIRRFFAVTGILLYALAFKFVGGGVRELQEAGWIGVTPAPVPNVAALRDWLAIYPFVEPLLAQAALILALVIGAGYAFVTRPGPEGAAPEPLRS